MRYDLLGNGEFRLAAAPVNVVVISGPNADVIVDGEETR